MLKKALLGGVIFTLGNVLDLTNMPKLPYIPWWEIVGILAVLLSLWIFLAWLRWKINRARVAKERVVQTKTRPIAPVIYQMPNYYPGGQGQTIEPPPTWHNLPKDKYELLA